ncbi:MAG: hypothetical protein U1A27_06155 [Phycisphaerae bacterium]
MQLFGTAFALGFAVAVIYMLAAGLTQLTRALLGAWREVVDFVVFVAWLVGAILLVRVLRREMFRSSRRWTVAFGLAAGLHAAALFPVTVIAMRMPDPVIVLLLIIGLPFTAVFFLIFTLAVSLFSPRVTVNDGTLCPGCEYCLIGNTTMICPECGRPFTFEQLGTTGAAFRARGAAGPASAPAIDPAREASPS